MGGILYSQLAQVFEVASDIKNGLGIEYSGSKELKRSGRWIGDTLFRSLAIDARSFPFNAEEAALANQKSNFEPKPSIAIEQMVADAEVETARKDRKSTRLNSSH